MDAEVTNRCLRNSWVRDHICLEARMGSYFYGANLDNTDVDLRGFYIPPRDMVFPFQKGEYIYGFGTSPSRVDVFEKTEGEFDVVLYNVVKIFDMLLKGNPNVMNVLLLREEDCLVLEECGRRLLQGREVFFSKSLVKTYVGFSNSCLKDITEERRDPEKTPKLMSLAYRQLFEVCEILKNDFDSFDPRSASETLLSLRRGEKTLDEFLDIYDKKRLEVSALEIKSDLPERTDELRVRDLLWETLEVAFQEK